MNAFAEIEPFGIHVDYRNRGFGKALLTEALKRLKKRKIERVYIGSGPEPAIANRLYESVGFSDKKIAFWWAKDLKK
jgi:ribosomal protein S18 acetylase RimI-like enzyme